VSGEEHGEATSGAARRRGPKDNRGRRAGLTRERILDAAVELIDRDGVEGFSVRRLAGGLGVDPMSLYNHVANKDDILDGVVESVMSELSLAHDPADTWQQQVRTSARAFRQVALAHPNVAIVMLTRRVLTEEPLRLLREAVSPALALGLPIDEAIDVVRTFTAFLTGSILRELGSGMTLAVADPELVRQRVEDVERSSDDVLAGAAHSIAEIDHEALFDYGVELFIAGLAARGAGRAAADASRT
jgi:AcrR family transcriptional regulator